MGPPAPRRPPCPAHLPACSLLAAHLPAADLGRAYSSYQLPHGTVWRTAYWGANYARLAAIKAAVDPLDLFTKPHTVEGWHVGLGGAPGAGTCGAGEGRSGMCASGLATE